MEKGWEYKKLKEIARITSGQGAPQGEDNYCDNGTPFIKAGNMESLVNGAPEESVQKVSNEVANNYKLKKYAAGSVLFAKSGMSCMKGWVYTLKNDCYVVSHLAIVTPLHIIPDFLNYYLRYIKTYSLVQDAAYPTISLKDIENLLVPTPPLEEQRSIVAILDAAFAKINALKNNAEKRLAEARYLYSRALTEEMNPKEGWDESLLGNIGTFKNGMNFSHNEKGYDLNIVGVGDFGNRFSIDNVEELTTVSLNQMPSEDYLLKDGDIVFVRSNGNKQLVGRSLVVYPKCHPVTFSGFCIRFRKSTTINERYLTYYLKCEGVRKKLFGNGANISNLNQKILQNLAIPIPSEDQQSVIVSYLDVLSDNVRKLEDVLTRTLTECDALKQAILKEVFE